MGTRQAVILPPLPLSLSCYLCCPACWLEPLHFTKCLTHKTQRHAFATIAALALALALALLARTLSHFGRNVVSCCCLFHSFFWLLLLSMAHCKTC